MMLKCNFKSITTQKFGNSIDENEDNILEPSELEINSDTLLKFAVSDGATESSFSKEWSRGATIFQEQFAFRHK